MYQQRFDREPVDVQLASCCMDVIYVSPGMFVQFRLETAERADAFSQRVCVTDGQKCRSRGRV